MAVAEHIEGSVLSTVVEHERMLLAELQAARDEARAIVDAARTEANAHEDNELAALNAEVAARRAQAERDRTAAYDATLKAANDALADTRKIVHGRVSAVADEVMALFVPQTGKGGKS